jgi:hypothetical protein
MSSAEVRAATSAGADAIHAFGDLLRGDVDPVAVASLLDGLTHDDRVTAIRSVERREQRNLFEAVAGFRPLHLTDLVGSDVRDLRTVRHYGKNTLPLFSHFEKRFCRAPGASPDAPREHCGFNVQTMQPVTGPGYFVAVEDPERDEVLVDYRRLPSAKPSDWPEIRTNERGLSRFVYGFMVDTLRRVSEHVSIGSAARKGKDLGSWFILCREA